jgi:hypothetical protein
MTDNSTVEEVCTSYDVYKPSPDWQPVRNLPPTGLLVLVLGHYHPGVALACCDAQGRWEVQPYKAAWYWTKEGVTHWSYLPRVWIEDE